MSFAKKIIFLWAALFVFVSLFSCKKEDDEVSNLNFGGYVYKYTVTYKTGYGTAPSSISVAPGTVLKSEHLPVLTATDCDYVFKGWYDDETQAVAGQYVVRGNVTLTAKWADKNGVDLCRVRFFKEYRQYYNYSPFPGNENSCKELYLPKNTVLTENLVPDVNSFPPVQTEDLVPPPENIKRAIKTPVRWFSPYSYSNRAKEIKYLWVGKTIVSGDVDYALSYADLSEKSRIYAVPVFPLVNLNWRPEKMFISQSSYGVKKEELADMGDSDIYSFTENNPTYNNSGQYTQGFLGWYLPKEQWDSADDIPFPDELWPGSYTNGYTYIVPKFGNLCSKSFYVSEEWFERISKIPAEQSNLCYYTKFEAETFDLGTLPEDCIGFDISLLGNWSSEELLAFGNSLKNSEAFSKGKSNRLHISDNVNELPENVFRDCKALEEMSCHVNKIGKGAFAGTGLRWASVANWSHWYRTNSSDYTGGEDLNLDEFFSGNYSDVAKLLRETCKDYYLYKKSE